MKRSAGWFVGAVAIAGMSLAALLILRPLLFQDSIRVVFVESDLDPCPASDAMRTGFLFALQERGYRGGRYAVKPVLARRYRAGLFLKESDAEPVFSDGSRAPDVAAVVTFQELPAGVQIPSTSVACLEADGAPAKGPCLLPTLETQGAAAARWAQRNGVRRVRVIGDNERIRRAFEAAAGGLVGDDKPDLVFFSGEHPPFGEATKEFRDLKAKGYAGRFLIADAFPRVSFVDAPGSLEDGCLLVSCLSPSPPEFQAPFEAFAGKRLGPHVYAGTLAGRALMDALDRGGALTLKLPDLPCALYVAKAGRFEFVELLR